MTEDIVETAAVFCFLNTSHVPPNTGFDTCIRPERIASLARTFDGTGEQSKNGMK